MKICVTGGAGFLGSHVADALSDAGHDVTIFDRMESPYLRPDQKMVVGNLLDRDAVNQVIAGCGAVYHFAAIADIVDAMENPLETVEINILGTTRILEACRHAGVGRFVFASTIYVYSNQGSFYRTSKQACEGLIDDYRATYGLPYTILRFGSLYGPRAGETNAIRRMLTEALREGCIRYQGTGQEMREYIHVYDAAAAATELLDKQYENAIMHLTGHEPMTTSNMLNMIREIIGNNVEIRLNEGSRVGHYVHTPYSYVPRIGRKLIRDTYIDIGLGLLHCAEEIDREQDARPQHPVVSG